MREIKFRAWHKYKKRMYQHICRLEFSNWNGEEHHLVSVFARNNDEDSCLDEAVNWELRQFTGLIDKNGKEIYEGDILADGTVSNMCVIWSERNASWCLRSMSWAFDHYFGEAVNAENCEVIGNIHEHPCLVKP